MTRALLRQFETRAERPVLVRALLGALEALIERAQLYLQSLLHLHVNPGLCAGKEMSLLSHLARLLHVLHLKVSQLTGQLLDLRLLAGHRLRNFLLLLMQRKQLLILRDLMQKFH